MFLNMKEVWNYDMNGFFVKTKKQNKTNQNQKPDHIQLTYIFILLLFGVPGLSVLSA